MASLSVYTRRLFIAHPPPGSSSVYTVPAGHSVVVRHVTAYGAPTDFPIAVLVDISGSQTVVHRFEAPSAIGSQDWECRVALNAGESIDLYGFGSGSPSLQATGYVFVE